MPKKIFDGLPFSALVVIDLDTPIDATFFDELISKNNIVEGITILIRSEKGHENRGGYFFHIKSTDDSNENFVLFNFEKEEIANLEKSKLIDLFNHCSGREYSEESYLICQQIINLRTDQS